MNREDRTTTINHSHGDSLANIRVRPIKEHLWLSMVASLPRVLIIIGSFSGCLVPQFLPLRRRLSVLLLSGRQLQTPLPNWLDDELGDWLRDIRSHRVNTLHSGRYRDESPRDERVTFTMPEVRPSDHARTTRCSCS